MAPRASSFLGRVRTYTGLFSAVGYNLGGLGVLLKKVPCAGFNCHGCPLASFSCPVGAMTYGSAVRVFPAMVVGFVLAVALLLGRLVCGFACPFGWFQDLLARVPVRKFRLPRAARYVKYLALALLVFALPLLLGFRASGYLKVAQEAQMIDEDQAQLWVRLENLGPEPVSNPQVDVVYLEKKSKAKLFEMHERFEGETIEPGGSMALDPMLIPNMREKADLIISSPQSVPQLRTSTYGYYCKICPTGTLTAVLPNMLTGSDRDDAIYGGLSRSWLRLAILLLFLVLMVFVSRPFCQTFCPLGAIYGIFSKFALTRIEVDRDACVDCGACNRVCPVDLDVVKEAGGPECIACGDCIKVCPVNAITRRFGIASPRTAAAPSAEGS